MAYAAVPSRTASRGVIGVNTPFLPRPPIDPIMALRGVFGEEMYIVQFQKPGEADAILAKDVGNTFRFFMRKNTITQEEYKAAPPEQRSLALLKALAIDEKDWRGEQLLKPEELKVFVDTFKRTGSPAGSIGIAICRATGSARRPSRRKSKCPV